MPLNDGIYRYGRGRQIVQQRIVYASSAFSLAVLSFPDDCLYQMRQCKEKSDADECRINGRVEEQRRTIHVVDLWPGAFCDENGESIQDNSCQKAGGSKGRNKGV